MNKLKLTIEAKQNLTKELFVLELGSLPDGFTYSPGQFLHIRVTDELAPLLRRPISIQSVRDGRLRLLVREVGKGTGLLRLLEPGCFLDALGPLGKGFSPGNTGERVLLVGGGVGNAPMLACMECFTEQTIDFCYGVRSADEVQGLDQSAHWKHGKVHIATEDGSAGQLGLVTAVAEKLLSQHHYHRVLTCGPWGMMAAVVKLASDHHIPVYSSLEVQMGCGIGACLGCVYRTVDGDMIRSCKEGPVVDGTTVDWEYGR